MNFITKLGTYLGGSGTKGWTVYARGNAWSGADERNDFGVAHWNGSGLISTLTMDSATGYVGIGTKFPNPTFQLGPQTNQF
jgi:hypothetical protein